jgi:hypothetical protein
MCNNKVVYKKEEINNDASFYEMYDSSLCTLITSVTMETGVWIQM